MLSNSMQHDVDTPSAVATPRQSLTVQVPPSGFEVDMMPLEDVRLGIKTLSESDKLDKAAALTVTRLHHEMELLLQHEKHVRYQEISTLRSQLEQNRLETELDRLARRHTLDEAQIQQMADGQRTGRSARR